MMCSLENYENVTQTSTDAFPQLASLREILYNRPQAGPKSSIENPPLSYIRSTDAALYYEEYGTGETLILLPDFLETIESDWRRFVPEFAQQFHTIVIDLRGHGKTNNPSGTLRFDVLLGDLHILFESLEIESAFVCAHGSLAWLAIQYVIGHEERVRGMILHAPEPLAANLAAAPAPEEFDKARSDILQHLHEPANGPDGWSFLLRAQPTLLQEIAQRVSEPGVLSSLHVPVLVTNGDQEGAEARRDSRAIASLFARGSFALVGQSGQALKTVQKKAFVEAVVLFARAGAGSR
jgi:pimeloyl-ACP methyl ester carboxylesterase